MKNFEEDHKKLIDLMSQVSETPVSVLLNEIEKNTQKMGQTQQEVGEALRQLQPALTPKLASAITVQLTAIDHLGERFRDLLGELKGLASQGDKDGLANWTYRVVSVLSMQKDDLENLKDLFEKLRTEMQHGA